MHRAISARRCLWLTSLRRQAEPSPRNSSACSSKAQEAQQHLVPLPLARRPAVHVLDVRSLVEWRQQTLAAILEVGDSWAERDGGPAASQLNTELTWTLQDTVDSLRERPEHAWRPQGWQALAAELQALARSSAKREGLLGSQLLCRAGLEELRHMWRARLGQRVPWQYLTSTAPWRSYTLSVGPGVLIPRPETEIMVDLVRDATRQQPALLAGPWADLGTGSGALAIGVADLIRDLLDHAGRPTEGVSVWAVDLSQAAIAYATFNARLTGLEAHVHVVQGSWFQPLQHLRGQLAGIVSNPPYIPGGQMAALQPEVGRHEPHSALDGGAGLGIDSLEPICRGAADMLRPGGFLALETAGGEQAHHVAAVLRNSQPPFVDVNVVRDYYGVERFVTAFKQPP